MNIYKNLQESNNIVMPELGELGCHFFFFLHRMSLLPLLMHIMHILYPCWIKVLFFLTKQKQTNKITYFSIVVLWYISTRFNTHKAKAKKKKKYIWSLSKAAAWFEVPFVFIAQIVLHKINKMPRFNLGACKFLKQSMSHSKSDARPMSSTGGNVLLSPTYVGRSEIEF